MTVYVSRHASGTIVVPQPSASAAVPVATGRATVSPIDPSLLTHAWRQVFAQRASLGGQR